MTYCTQPCLEVGSFSLLVYLPHEVSSRNFQPPAISFYPFQVHFPAPFLFFMPNDTMKPMHFRIMVSSSILCCILVQPNSWQEENDICRFVHCQVQLCLNKDSNNFFPVLHFAKTNSKIISNCHHICNSEHVNIKCSTESHSYNCTMLFFDSYQRRQKHYKNIICRNKKNLWEYALCNDSLSSLYWSHLCGLRLLLEIIT